MLFRFYCSYYGVDFILLLMFNIPMYKCKIYKGRNINKEEVKMDLDKISIRARIRKIREDIFNETRQLFAERCALSENHLGKLERGEILISITTLDKICSRAGIKTDYILYGKSENKHLNVRKTIDNFLDKSSKEELKMYFKFISTIKSFIKLDD